MKISLLSDAPHHNLALMKISAYHKAECDEVMLNAPIFPADYTYASILYERNKNEFVADEYGGPVFSGSVLPDYINEMKPDYDLYGYNFSLGYTFRPCFNTCDFCYVPKMVHPDVEHHSIWEFHNSEFKNILLLNNNTFQDPRWKETFEEIWDADLTVEDANGYDLRLLDEEKAEALKKTKWLKWCFFAWDRIQDDALMIRGLKIARKYKLRTRIYVLCGYDTTLEEDFYRCEKIIKYKFDPYIMPYLGKTKASKRARAFKRFMDTFSWRKYKTIAEGWNNYRYKI
jgi:hypothetical protein